MDIHPLIVHFPIALLTMYSLLEVGAYFLPALRRQEWISQVKSFLLFVGALAALAALVSGGIAEEIARQSAGRSPILKIHSSFAGAATLFYIILAAAYTVRLFDAKGWGNRIIGNQSLLIRIWHIKKYLAYLILDSWLLPLIAFCALFGLFVAGALGAAMVYGPDADPFVSFIYRLFLP